MTAAEHKASILAQLNQQALSSAVEAMAKLAEELDTVKAELAELKKPRVE